MKNSPVLKASTLCLALAIWGCGGSSSNSSAGSFSNTNSGLGSSAVSGTSVRIAVPPEGGTVTLPATGGIVGTLNFAAGARPGTVLSLIVSDTPPPGAPGPDGTVGTVTSDGFYYILWQTNQPFDFNLINTLSLAEVGTVKGRVQSQIRGRVMPNDAELYTGELDAYSGSSASYLDSLPGTFNSSDGTSTFGGAQSVPLLPETAVLLQIKAINQRTIQVTFTNDSGVEPAYVSVLGQSPLQVSPGVEDPKYYHVDKDGKMQAFLKSDRNSRITTDPNGFVDGYTDKYNLAFTGKTATFDLPLMRAGRMYVTLGRKLQTRLEDDRTIRPAPVRNPDPNGEQIVPLPIVRLAQPDGWTNIGDPNYSTMFDWLEFDYKVNVDNGLPGIGINKTEVDMMGFGVQFTLEGPTIGSKTLGTLTNDRSKIFEELEADSFFKELIVKTPALGEDGNPLASLSGIPLRAIAPVKGLDNRKNNRGAQYQYFDDTYFDSYLTAVWSYYETHNLKFATSAFGTWSGSVNPATQRMEFVCVLEQDGETPPRPGYQKIYVRKPSTTNAFEPTELITSGGITYEPSPGNFVRVPDPPPVVPAPGPTDNPVLFTPYVANEMISALSAAMNRTTLLHQELITRDYRRSPADKTKFYLKQNQTQRINVYAKTIHDHSLLNPPDAPGPPASNGGGAAYAFGFDDNSNQSSFMAELTNPTALKITILPIKKP